MFLLIAMVLCGRLCVFKLCGVMKVNGFKHISFLYVCEDLRGNLYYGKVACCSFCVS